MRHPKAILDILQTKMGPQERFRGKGIRMAPRRPAHFPNHYGRLYRPLSLQPGGGDIVTAVDEKYVESQITPERIGNVVFRHHTKSSETLDAILKTEKLLAERKGGGLRQEGICAVTDIAGIDVTDGLVGKGSANRLWFTVKDPTDLQTSRSMCSEGDMVTVKKVMAENENKTELAINIIAYYRMGKGVVIVDKEAFAKKLLPTIADFGDNIDTKIVKAIRQLQKVGALPKEVDITEESTGELKPTTVLIKIHEEGLREHIKKTSLQHNRYAERVCNSITEEHTKLQKAANKCLELMEKLSIADENHARPHVEALRSYAETTRPEPTPSPGFSNE